VCVQVPCVYLLYAASSVTERNTYCTGSCEPGSRCHPNECIFGGEKPRGVGNLELGVYEQGERIGEFSLQAIGDQGGRILSQQGGFQVSERGSERGARGISKGNASCIL
jgi:hypothetical protein